METSTILKQLDDEIARLKQARAMLDGRNPTPKKRRKLTPEGRARIAAAQKKRWAAKKK